MLAPALKIFGFILVSITGFLIGEYKARDISRRTQILYAMQGYLLLLAQNIKYKKDALPMLLSNSAALPEFSVLNFKPKATKTQNWPCALKAELDEMFYSIKQTIRPEEFELFSTAILKLGHGDANADEDMLLYQKDRINNIYATVQGSEALQKKLFRSLGLAAGISAAIIMM